mmetsp:Transcript_64106/g.179345  ORF Transcript_64106/g.179345 Transcript_64106/m.179345 type:complete len:269 (+) Transcript_64106:379-1185(+)
MANSMRSCFASNCSTIRSSSSESPSLAASRPICSNASDVRRKSSISSREMAREPSLSAIWKMLSKADLWISTRCSHSFFARLFSDASASRKLSSTKIAGTRAIKLIVPTNTKATQNTHIRGCECMTLEVMMTTPPGVSAFSDTCTASMPSTMTSNKLNMELVKRPNISCTTSSSASWRINVMTTAPMKSIISTRNITRNIEFIAETRVYSTSRRNFRMRKTRRIRNTRNNLTTEAFMSMRDTSSSTALMTPKTVMRKSNQFQPHSPAS